MKPGLCFQRSECCSKATAETCGGRCIDTLRQAYEIHISIPNSDIFCKRTPSGESWLELIVADLLISAEARPTVATACHEGHGDSLPWFPILDILANFNNSAGKFVSWYMRKHDIRIVSLPPMPIATADASCIDFEYDAIVRSYRIRDINDID